MNNSEVNFSGETNNSNFEPNNQTPPKIASAEKTPTPTSVNFEKAEKKYTRKKQGKKILLISLIALVLLAGGATILYFLPNLAKSPEEQNPVNTYEASKTALNIARNTEQEGVQSAIDYLNNQISINKNEEQKNDLRISKLEIYMDQNLLGLMPNEITTIQEESLTNSQKFSYYNLLCRYYAETGDVELNKFYAQQAISISKELIDEEK